MKLNTVVTKYTDILIFNLEDIIYPQLRIMSLKSNQKAKYRQDKSCVNKTMYSKNKEKYSV